MVAIPKIPTDFRSNHLFANVKLSQKDELTIINQSRRLLLNHDATERVVCKQLYISETGLRNLYHKYFDMSPKQYMRKVHMTRARTLLRTTTASVPKIALTLNYMNVSKFARVFKQEFGVSPFQYRKSLQSTVPDCGYATACKME